MKERLFATMLLFTCILSLASCSKDDGDWDAMKWEKNNYEEALTPSFGKAIGVPKSGGTYTFKCKNYKNFWIEYVNESVGDKTIKNVPSYDDKPYSEVKGSIHLQRWKEIRSLLHLRQTKHRMDVMFV